MEYIKQHKVASIVVGIAVLLVVALVVFFTVMGNLSAVETSPITFAEKYADADSKIDNIITTDAKRQGYKSDLLLYSDKVKKDYDMSIDDKDAFMTFVRKIDAESVNSKMHVLSFYGKVKKQFDADVNANYFADDVRALVDNLFTEYNKVYKENKYQEAYYKLDEISKYLSVRVTEDGIMTEDTAEEEEVTTEEVTPSSDTETSTATGKGYHPEASVGQVVVDPNNGNTGVVASNGIEVYTLPNESTYSYISKDEFVAMLVRSGTREALAKIWAEQMANEEGFITIGVDDDGSYE